jgi:hypothetical protein
MTEWLLEEGALDAERAFAGRGELGPFGITGTESDEEVASSSLAIFLKPLVVTNTRKWFGEADIRLDALVAQGGGEAGDLYQPRTFRFPRVSDGEDLANADNGLLVYYGRPKHFLALTVTLARDTQDSDDLKDLIEKQARSEEVGSVLTTMASAIASPHVAAVQAAMQAALTFGDVAYGLIRQISPKVLGLYRANWLANKDDFGVGRHPPQGALAIKDFQLAYEIVPDEAPSAERP